MDVQTVQDRIRPPGPAADSLERLVPDQLAAGEVTGLRSLKLHLERYQLAARHLSAGRLLDAGCGVGYGTRLLAEHGNNEVKVLGVDVSPQAIAYARLRYGAEAVEFRVFDASTFEDVEGFDVIVALEIVEHVEDPRALIDRLVTLLRPGGVLVASVPTTPSVDLNPHHRHDFTERSFRKLFAGHDLVEIDCLRQRQPIGLKTVLHRREARMTDLRRGLASYYLRHPTALLRRLVATTRYGLANRYATIVWRQATD